jgi:hypothetical protein
MRGIGVAEKEYEVEWRNVQTGSITIFAHSHEKAQEIVRAMSLPELEESIVEEDFEIEWVNEL